MKKDEEAQRKRKLIDDTMMSILREIKKKSAGENGKTDRFDRQFVIQAAYLCYGKHRNGQDMQKGRPKEPQLVEDRLKEFMEMDDAELDEAMQEK